MDEVRPRRGEGRAVAKLLPEEDSAALRSAARILSLGTRLSPRVSPTFESVQMSHLVGSICHGFTPLR